MCIFLKLTLDLIHNYSEHWQCLVLNQNFAAQSL